MNWRPESKACYLYSRCYIHTVLLASSRARRMINLPAKAHLLSFTKPIYFLLLLQPTGYFKPDSKNQILLQSHQSDFSLQGTCSTQSLTELASMLFIYSFYLFLLLPENQPELWRELTTETSRNWEMLRKAVFSHPLSKCWCTSVGMCYQDHSCKSEDRHGLGLSAKSCFGAQIRSTLSPNLPAVCSLHLE